MAPVLAKNIKIASKEIDNADIAALACREAGLPYYMAVPLLVKESGGANIYGHDGGAVYSYDDHRTVEVTEENFLNFLIRVMNGEISNGVGPCQITYAGSLVNKHRDGGYFREMASQNLLPYVPFDNMVFGFTIMRKNYEKTRSVFKAGAQYNGGANYGPKAVTYGNSYARLVTSFKKQFLGS